MEGVGDLELEGLEEMDIECTHYHYAATITVLGKHGQELWKVQDMLNSSSGVLCISENLDKGLTFRVRKCCIQYKRPRRRGLQTNEVCAGC